MMRLHRAARTVLTTLLGVGVSGGAAIAQTVDYGTLEQIFGQPVTTSATGTPKLRSDAPVAMEIITADDIRRSGAADIPGILRGVAGVDVWRTTLARADVAVRGYNHYQTPRLLVLVNGRQVYLDGYGMTIWDTLPVELGEIRQIEVIKGPNAPLFGFNAVGGVVNIITYSPLYDDVDTATVRVGTQEHRQISVVGAFKPSPKSGLRLSAGGYDAREFDTPFISPTVEAQAEPFRTDASRRSVNADGLLQLTDRMQLGLEASRVESRGSFFSVAGEYGWTDTRVTSAKATLTAETDFGLLEATTYGNWFDFDYTTSGTRDLSRFDAVRSANNLKYFRLQNIAKPAPEHTLRLFGEYRNTEFTGDLVPAEMRQRILSAGATWDWTINRSITLTNAVRLDHLTYSRGQAETPTIPQLGAPFPDGDFDRTLDEIGASSAIVVKASDLDTLRLSVARGIQPPSLLEVGSLLGGRHPTLGFFRSVGNPQLDPTTVTNVEFGWERRLPDWNAVLKTSVYHQINENLKTQSRPTLRRGVVPVIERTFVNAGDSRALGGEISLAGAFGAGWRWEANYAYEIVDDDLTLNGSGRDFYLIPERSTPRHRVNGRIGYARGPFEADLTAHMVSGYDAIYQPYQGRNAPTHELRHVPTHIVLGGRLAYDVTDTLTVAVEGQAINLADHAETAAPDVERRVFLSITSRF